jgi:WhiB family redox-sensing transcriptional regulator
LAVAAGCPEKLCSSHAWLTTFQEHPRPNFAQTITQSGVVTAHPYRVGVNEALVQWLMSAPDGPDELLTLEDFLQRPVWHERAACLGMGLGAFVRSEKADYGATRELCASCPVRQECLGTALADDSLVGLWGGTTEREQREMRRRVA